MSKCLSYPGIFVWSVQARLIVENMHLHILPSMNPDGYALKRRGNANNIDLNRDFPDQVTSWNFGFPQYLDIS